MKKFSSIVLSFSLITLCLNAFAKPYRVPTNRVIYQVSAEHWVKSDDAMVTVGVVAAVKDADIAKVRQGLLAKLKQINDADWHITRFDRNVDQSGLERINITAKARIKEEKLSKLRGQAKKISQAGETYRINNIDFRPSLAAQQAVKDALRAEIYKKVNAEIGRLNSAYPKQNFTVYRLNFLPMSSYYQRGGNRSNKMMTMAMAQPALESAPLSVSQKVLMSALVVLASDRNAQAVAE